MYYLFSDCQREGEDKKTKEYQMAFRQGEYGYVLHCKNDMLTPHQLTDI
jgi:hypothetical protein